MGEILMRQEVVYALVCKKTDDRVVRGTGYERVAEKQEGMETAGTRLGPQKVSEVMHVVGRIM